MVRGLYSFWSASVNERIKELMNQAAKQYYADTGEIKPNDMMYIFAELIVRECITTMTNLESDIKQQFPWKKEDVVSTSGHIQKLKEHFGVES